MGNRCLCPEILAGRHNRRLRSGFPGLWVSVLQNTPDITNRAEACFLCSFIAYISSEYKSKLLEKIYSYSWESHNRCGSREYTFEKKREKALVNSGNLVMIRASGGNGFLLVYWVEDWPGNGNRKI